MAEMTEAEWQNLYENFETTWLTSAVENIDTLRGLLADRENGEPPEIRDDLLKLHGLAIEVVNNGVTSKAEALFELAQAIEFQVTDMIEALEFIQRVFDRLNELYPDSLAEE